jgi:hypothetical protein
MDIIWWVVGSNVATFILAWVISSVVTKHKFMREQQYLEQKQKNTAMWIDYIKEMQGGKNA